MSILGGRGFYLWATLTLNARVVLVEWNPLVPPQPQPLPEMCSGSEVGSYLRVIDSGITQRKAQGPSRTCNESKEEETKRVEAQCLNARVVLIEWNPLVPP